MNILKIAILTFPLFILNSQAMTDTGTRGGGRAMVCRDFKQKIISARMLDTIEGVEPAPVGYGFKISETHDEKTSQARRDLVIDRLLGEYLKILDGLPALQTALSEVIYKTKAERVIEDADFDLIPPEDLGQIHLIKKAKNCHLEPVGVYFEDGKLHVNPEIYSAMDSLNQAVFFFHEGFYTFARKHRDIMPIHTDTSEGSRESIGLFASLPQKISRYIAQIELRLKPEVQQDQSGDNTYWSTIAGTEYLFSINKLNFIPKELPPNEVQAYFGEKNWTSKGMVRAYHYLTPLQFLCEQDQSKCTLLLWNEQPKELPFDEITYDPATHSILAKNSKTGVVYLIGAAQW